MKIALLGLPQAGKKTLFTLLTQREVSPARKPDEAIEGIAAIRDDRVDALSAVSKPERTIYAENNFVLCPDVIADDRAWLDAARSCDLICPVVRAFHDDAVYHPAGSVDAKRDLANLTAELMLADMELAEKRLERLTKEKRSGLTPAQEVEERAVAKCMAALESDQRLEDTPLNEQETAAVGSLNLATSIPLLPIYNVSEDSIGSDATTGVNVSCLIEGELMAIEDPVERHEFMEGLELEQSGLDRVNAAAYAAQGLLSFYTTGPKESRAWTIRRGASAPEAGGRIHTDIERGFIRVEIIKFDDFIAAGSEKDAKDQGKMQLKGKDYVMQDGDVCHFLFNV